MPNYRGDLIDKDTLRLLAALRYVREAIGDNTANIVATEYVVGGVRVLVTIGQFLDAVLDTYKDFDVEDES